MPVPRNKSGGRVERIASLEHNGTTVRVLAEWRVVGGRAEPVRIDIRLADEMRPLTTELIRRLPLGAAIAGMRRDLAFEGKFPGVEGDPTSRLRTAARRGPQRGSTLTDDDLSAVAAAYKEARRWGRPVTEAVAETCGVSLSTAGKRIMKARKAGLLDDGRGQQ